MRAVPGAELLESVGESNNRFLEGGEGYLASDVLGLALSEEGDLAAVPRFDVTVDAVAADVQLAAEVSLRVAAAIRPAPFHGSNQEIRFASSVQNSSTPRL